jgi:hypothetical protein
MCLGSSVSNCLQRFSGISLGRNLWKEKEKEDQKQRKKERALGSRECEQLSSKKATFGRLVTHMHAALLHCPKELASFFFIR